MTTLRPTFFMAGDEGPFRITRIEPVVGESLPLATYLTVAEAPSASCRWLLQGTTGHVRYVEREEKRALAAVTPSLARAEATCAALIPIRKSAAWWDLAQDERRAILAQSSQHITLGMSYLPAIARRLYQSRELGQAFDFLTWFEYAPEHAGRFEELVQRLRDTEEWTYVEREVDVRLTREHA